MTNETKIEGVNPKDLIGSTKPELSLIPATALPHVALAMMNGALKYGPYNWREPGKPVTYMAYINAIDRHNKCFLDGENEASDSLVHHLAHIASTAMVLLDAIENGVAIDNRPVRGKTAEVIDRLQHLYKTKLKDRWLQQKAQNAAMSTKAN